MSSRDLATSASTSAASTTSGADVSLHQVSRRYSTGRGDEVAALRDVSLDIAAGQTVAVIGPSGSGKSTLLHILGGMDRPTSGEVRVGRHRLDLLKPRDLTLYRRDVGFVFQKYHLLPALTALDNVVAPLLPRRSAFDRRARAQALLDAVGLGDRAKAMPSQLSGGQQQRVAIARALIASPSLLLADEPTGGLDSATGHDVMTLMLRLANERGSTLVVVTHNADVASMCSRTLEMHDGSFVAGAAS